VQKFEKVMYDFTYAEMDDELSDADWKRAKESLANATARLEFLFREQLTEIERLRSERAQREREVAASLALAGKMLQDTGAELASLKEEQLTPEEARSILEGITYRATRDKLRSISERLKAEAK